MHSHQDFSHPDQTFTFLDGSTRSVLFLNGLILGQGTYRPGWRWSRHVGAMTGKTSQAHTGYVISGRMRVREANGDEFTVGPGEAFTVSAGHDGWVLGDEPCVALDFEEQ